MTPHTGGEIEEWYAEEVVESHGYVEARSRGGSRIHAVPGDRARESRYDVRSLCGLRVWPIRLWDGNPEFNVGHSESCKSCSRAVFTSHAHTAQDTA